MKFNIIAIGACCLLFNGCVPNAELEAEYNAKVAKATNTIPVCNTKEDCDAKWEAAQLWIVHNAGYKIQTATSAVIETYNPAEYDTAIAARVTKEPMGKGKYKLVLKTWCANLFGCSINDVDAIISFNNAINSMEQ